MPERRNRADRILDAAGDLLLRLGYRKVTIEDIAKQAGIGKGTVYLHWRTKDLLFQALFLRESADLTEELLDVVRREPAEVAPHRFIATSFVLTHRRPLLLALSTGDLELLGKLTDTPMTRQDQIAGDRFYELMCRHRLLRADVPNLIATLQAVGLGFYLYPALGPEELDISAEAKAEALAHIFRHAFEPPEPPGPAVLATAASEVCVLFENLITSYREWIYQHAPQENRYGKEP